MNRAVISLGSNIDPEIHICKAKEQIGLQCCILAESTVVETEPVGFIEQPNFLNGTVLIETDMELAELDDCLHRIEKVLGRVHGVNKYGPRTIDLDIVVWNGEIIDEDIQKRDFLKEGVLEVWPDIVL